MTRVRAGISALPAWGLVFAFGLLAVVANLAFGNAQDRTLPWPVIVALSAVLGVLLWLHKPSDTWGILAVLFVTSWVVETLDLPRAADLVLFVMSTTALTWAVYDRERSERAAPRRR